MSGDIYEDGERDLEAEAQATAKEKRKRRKVKDEAEALDRAYRAVLSTVEGRAVFWHILGDLGLYQTPLVPGSQDLTYANIGRHNAALELMARLNDLAPDDFEAMHKENRK